MSKWYGQIGFANSEEQDAGVWVNNITERNYYGDVLSIRWKHENSGNTIDNINLSNQISIVSDPYANEHCSSIVYVTYMDTKWKVADVEIQFPRLLLSIGGVYNGD